MLAGIGILIFAAQFHVMLDFRPIGSGVQNLLGIPGALWSAISTGDYHLTAGEVGLLTVAVIAAWGTLTPKSWRVLPAPLVGVAVAMIAAGVLGLDDIK
jgi:MFS superfamily sulfate permease-like transporter